MGLKGNAVFLQCQLIIAHSLEGSGSGAYAAYGKAFQLFYNGTGFGKVFQILLKVRTGRMNHMRGIYGVLNAVLVEHVFDTQLAAEGVSSGVKVHFTDLVGIGLYEDRHTGVPAGGYGAVLISKVGKTDDYAVEAALVFF